MVTDTQLRRDVIAELAWEPSIDASELGVAVNRGTVTLSGHVGSLEEKQTAATATRRVRGVRGLDEGIEVRMPEGRTCRDQEIARRAADILLWRSPALAALIRVSVAEGGVTLAGAVEHHHDRVRAEQDIRLLSGVRHVANQLTLQPAPGPADMQAKIVSAYERSAEIEAERLLVAALGNTVILTGRVRSWSERDLAERIAWAAPGVADVRNRIVVET